MARILITGGAGFIGSNIAHALVARGDLPIVYDNFASGRRENLAGIEQKIEVVAGDIKDFDRLTRSMQGVDYVLHQAAVPSVPRSMDDPRASHEANALGTLNVLLAARDQKVKRVVYAASSSAYGESPTLPKIETMTPSPKSPYAVDKLYGEHLANVFWTGFGLETVSLRYFNIFGPRQRPDSDYAAAIPRFITRLLEGQRPTVYGDGEQSRDFTYVENAVHANILAMTAKDAPGETVNIGIGERITLNRLIATLADVLGVSGEIDYQPARKGDVLHSLASIEKARRILGYEAVVDLKEGLRRTIAYYRESTGKVEQGR
jgi:nucleoside-diphosphate-sugar epimerase